MKALLFILTITVATNLYAKTEYTTWERLALLLPGNEQKLHDYKTELYNQKFEEAQNLITSAYLAYLDFKDTDNVLYLNRAILLADNFNSNLRFLAHNQQYGNKEELITLATLARYEFYYEFDNFIYRSWTQSKFDIFEIGNFKALVFNFENVYFYDLGQPRNNN